MGDLVQAANCPLCAAGIVLLGIFAPRIAAFAGPLLQVLFSRLAAPAPATPTPAPAVPAPATVPTPAPLPGTPLNSTGRPLVDAGLQLLNQFAIKRFPNAASSIEAVEQFLLTEGNYLFHYDPAPSAPAK